MKHNVRKIVYLTLAVLILCSSYTMAEKKEFNKDETVYVKLNNNGTVDTTIVVNRLFDIAANEITDYGDYKNIKALNSNIQPTIKDGEIVWYNPNGFKEDFFYQATVDKELPVLFKIVYYLDGTEIKGEELAGKTGELMIVLSVNQNPNIDEKLENVYLTQIQIPLDLNKVDIKESLKAMRVVTGSTIFVSYSVVPNNNETFTLKMDIKDFEMKAMQISLVKYDSIISEEYNELSDGLEKMEDGMYEINDGTAELKNGLTDLVKGVKDLDNGLGELNNGGKEFENGLQEYETGLTEFSKGFSTAVSGLNEATSSLEQLNQSSDQIISGYNELYIGLGQLQEEHEKLVLIAQSLLQSPDPNIQALAYGVIAENEGLKAVLQGMSEANDGLEAYFTGLDGLYRGIFDINQAFNKLNNGAAVLTNTYSQMVVAGKDYFSGLGVIKTSVSKMYKEIETIPNDLSKLLDGQYEIAKGLSKMRSQFKTSDYGAEPKNAYSFVDNNQIVNSVQFLIVTPEIKQVDKSEQVNSDIEKKEESLFARIWNKIVKLFKE